MDRKSLNEQLLSLERRLMKLDEMEQQLNNEFHKILIK
jgi:hypothetical protein